MTALTVRPILADAEKAQTPIPGVAGPPKDTVYPVVNGDKIRDEPAFGVL